MSCLHAAFAEAPPDPEPTPIIKAPTYADACQVDFSFLRSPQPHGFLRVSPNGTFVWKDGDRARFWGVNIANRNLWVPRAEIDHVVGLLARAGTNLVRFEALDSRGGLLDVEGQPGTRQLNAQRLDTLHYWIMRCKENRICYYLDLLDFRDFKPEDGVEATLNRGARPYAMFDPHLIALQKEYATALLTTRNPYTGQAPVEDPDFALLEICNEHGFFLNPELNGQMVEPYKSRFRAMWNQWLVGQYGNRERLLAKWKRLGDDEDPLVGTVALPTLIDPARGRGPRPVDPRLADEVAFLHGVQRGYFKSMVSHLRSIGVQIPVTAVVSNDVAPDLASVAAECDFLSENFYADHPRFEGKEWEGKYRFRNLNQLREGGPGAFAPYTSALRWFKKPVVIREWGTVWPNRYRATSVPQAVAYAALQDFDGMLLFGYKTGDYADRLVFFGYQADPTVWGLYSLGAVMFLRGDIAASSAEVTFVYTLATLLSFPNGVTDAHRLAWLVRVNAETAEQAPPALPLQKSPRSLSRALEAGPLVLRAAASPGSVVDVLAGLGFSLWSARQRLQRGVFESSTGQITLDTRLGVLRVHTPTACIVSGEIGGDAAVTAGALSVKTTTPVASVVAVSLDGQPLPRSRRFIVKMVTVAENSGQNLVPAQSANGLPDFVLATEGKGPVRTLGVPSKTPTQVLLDGRPLVTVGMENGVWELYVDDGDIRFGCDTPNVAVTVKGKRLITERGRTRL